MRTANSKECAASNPAETQALIRPVLLSGGWGARLWPLSRQSYPKQFLSLMEETSLFSRTLGRVADRTRYLAPIIVCHREHECFITQALRALHIEDAYVLFEPYSRNTAPACITAALHGAADALHLVLPCDHLISDEEAFHTAIARAGKEALQGQILLFGITPDGPQTGYGYIMPDTARSAQALSRVTQFHEKPTAQAAAVYIKKGALWNSGMFLYPPALMRDETQRLNPKQYHFCESAWINGKDLQHGMVLSAEFYELLESHPLDTLVMEHTDKARVLACDMGWSDVGTLQSLWQEAAKDEHHNAVTGNVTAKEVEHCYLHADQGAIVALGLKECAVVSTAGVTFIGPLARAQEVKDMAALAARAHPEIISHHPTTLRPWGKYEVLARGAQFCVKQVTVYPRQSISLQLHRHRTEHWTVLSGTAQVECDGIRKILAATESFTIPVAAKHRLTNVGEQDLQVLEVQSGSYVGEDDIERFDDAYGRVPAVVESVE